MKLTLFGCYSDNCCAYCCHHQCSLTVKQMKKKECLRKQCHHLRKNTEHPIWHQRAMMKQHRHMRKQLFQETIDQLMKHEFKEA